MAIYSAPLTFNADDSNFAPIRLSVKINLRSTTCWVWLKPNSVLTLWNNWFAPIKVSDLDQLPGFDDFFLNWAFNRDVLLGGFMHVATNHNFQPTKSLTSTECVKYTAIHVQQNSNSWQQSLNDIHHEWSPNAGYAHYISSPIVKGIYFPVAAAFSTKLKPKDNFA